jgi:membrane protein required for colicin V production
MSLAFTFVDLLTVAIVVVSTAYAIYRGFVSETLLIVAPAAAALAALYFGPFIGSLLRGMVSSPMLAQLAGYAVVFVAIFLPISFLSYRISQSVKSSSVGPLDRSLGFAFGIVRGLAIVGLAYLIFTAIIPIRNQPGSVRDARLLPLIQGSGEVLLALAPERDRYRIHEERDAAPSAERPSGDAIAAPSPKPRSLVRNSRRRGQKAYGADDRRALDRLIETTGSGGNQ